MLGPLLNNGSIANAQSPLLFNHQEGSQIIQANYAGHPLAVSDSSRPAAGRRRSDELSMLTAERYADLEWPVKRALTFGYTNYASPQDLSKISTDKRNHDRSGRLGSLDPLDDSLETKEQLAKYYFKLFPFSAASDYQQADAGNRSSDPFDFESQDEAYIKSRKRLKANARRLSQKAKGANSSNKPANSNENFKSSRFFSKSNSIDSSSSSSSSSSPQSSRRSSTDSIDNGGAGDSANSGGLTLEDQGNTNGLSFEELEDDDVQVEKELNDDEDFSILEELNDDERGSGRSGSNSPNRTKNTVLEERDLSDKQLLKSLMASGGGQSAKSPTHPELTNENRKPSEFSSSNSNNQTNSNSIASLSKLSNSSESPFHNLPSSNTSSHFSRVVADHLGDSSSSSNSKRRSSNQMLLESLDLPSHTNELLDDSEDDDDNLDQYITTMSIIKKSRNVRHSKPLAGPADQGRNLAANKDDFVLLPDVPGTAEYAGESSAKKRRDFVERSEMLPEPAALQSSSLSNQWINSTSPPFPTSTSVIRPSASSNSSSSSFDPNDSTVDRSTLNAARTWKTKLFLTMKIIAISTVILLAIFGNLLVIISVLRHHKLRTLPNYFVVSFSSVFRRFLCVIFI